MAKESEHPLNAKTLKTLCGLKEPVPWAVSDVFGRISEDPGLVALANSKVKTLTCYGRGGVCSMTPLSFDSLVSEIG